MTRRIVRRFHRLGANSTPTWFLTLRCVRLCLVSMALLAFAGASAFAQTVVTLTHVHGLSYSADGMKLVREWTFDREGKTESLRRQIYAVTCWIHEGIYFALLSVYEYPGDVSGQDPVGIDLDGLKSAPAAAQHPQHGRSSPDRVLEWRGGGSASTEVRVTCRRRPATRPGRWRPRSGRRSGR